MPFDYGWGAQMDFWVKFPAVTRKPDQWKEEIYAGARLIADTAKKPLWVCSSGGIDSELVCRAFLEQGISFSVLTIEHLAGTNKHDIKFAKKWCEEQGINHKIVTLDMAHFIFEEIPRYITEGYVADDVFRFFQIKLLELVESMGGYAILGGGEQLYSIDESNKTLTEENTHLSFDPGYAASLEWCKRAKTMHQPYFYFSTPELMLAYLQIPIVDFCVKNPDIFRHKTNTYSFKRIVYQSIWPDLQPRFKYNGFEYVQNQGHEVRKRMREQLGRSVAPYILTIPMLKQQLHPQHAS